jgi:hypothetical protein
MTEPTPNLVFDGLQVDPNKEKIVLDHIKLIDMCMIAIENFDGDEEAKVDIFLPTMEFLDTKMNKVYIIPKDDSSPQGVIVRGNINALKFKPYACARFNAYDMLSWLVVLTDDMEEQEKQQEQE